MKELEPFREEIDEIDDKIIALLKRRFEIVRAVGHFKAEHGIKVVQSKRADEVVERNVENARMSDVPDEFIRRFYISMIDEAHIIEHDIVGDAEQSTGDKA